MLGLWLWHRLSEAEEAQERPPSPGDRAVAAVAYFGVPLYGPILPLILCAVSAPRSFRRLHGGVAFTQQCTFLLLYLPVVTLFAFGVLSASVIAVLLALAFLVELPQAVRALLGRRPLRVIPLRILPE
jgi:hypothetical protein